MLFGIRLSAAGIFVFAVTACFGTRTPSARTGSSTIDSAKTAPEQRAPDPDKIARRKKAKEPQQSYLAAWQLICAAERRTGLPPDADRQARGAAVAKWIVDNIKNRKVRQWFIDFGQIKGSIKRERIFRAEAQKVGVDPCDVNNLLFPPKKP